MKRLGRDYQWTFARQVFDSAPFPGGLPIKSLPIYASFASWGFFTGLETLNYMNM
jgi:hypothetical protein